MAIAVAIGAQRLTQKSEEDSQRRERAHPKSRRLEGTECHSDDVILLNLHSARERRTAHANSVRRARTVEHVIDFVHRIVAPAILGVLCVLYTITLFMLALRLHGV